MKLNSERRTIKIGWIALALALVVLILPLALWFQMRAFKRPAFLSPPAPNGYETFVAAAKELNGVDPRNVTSGLDAFVSEHSKLYELFESGLKESAEAPAIAYNAKTIPFNDMIAFRRLGNAIEIKARGAEGEERWRDAALIYADIIQFGQKVENGPLINFLVGSAIESAAVKRIENLIPRLGESELKEVGEALLRLNRSRTAFEQILERERYFAVMNGGNIFRLVQARLTGQMRKMKEGGQERYSNSSAYLEVVAASMAVRRFSLQEHKMPRRIEELTPKYLAEIPQDPYSGKPLLLTASKTNIVVYSVGPNLKDDRAKADDVAANYSDQVGYQIISEGLSRMEK
jgi:hypothetical protein